MLRRPTAIHEKTAPQNRAKHRARSVAKSSVCLNKYGSPPMLATMPSNLGFAISAAMSMAAANLPISAANSTTLASRSPVRSGSLNGSSTTMPNESLDLTKLVAIWKWSARSAAPAWPRHQSVHTRRKTSRVQVRFLWKSSLSVIAICSTLVTKWGSLRCWNFGVSLQPSADSVNLPSSTAAAHPRAAVLPDFYHIYKGGNQMQSLGMIEASRMPLFHINDYPNDPAQPEIADKDRVFPGDGVCPLVDTIAMLIRNGFTGTFSLELFNPSYWQRPAEKSLAKAIRNHEL